MRADIVKAYTPVLWQISTTRVVTKLVCMICFLVKESDSDTVIMVIILVVGVGGIFLLFAIMALCYR